MKGKAAENTFNFQVRVYYEDTDAGGVVYHSRYLHFMERARTEWLRSLGFKQCQLMREEEILFAVKKISIDYLRPALFDDILDIRTLIIDRYRVSLDFEQLVTNQSQETICQAQVKIVCLSTTTMKPKIIPAPILSAFN